MPRRRRKRDMTAITARRPSGEREIKHDAGLTGALRVSDLAQASAVALALILGLDGDLLRIVRLSLGVSLPAVAVAGVISLPLGAALGRGRASPVGSALHRRDASFDSALRAGSGRGQCLFRINSADAALRPSSS
jgi:hypothetical protein